MKFKIRPGQWAGFLSLDIEQKETHFWLSVDIDHDEAVKLLHNLKHAINHVDEIIERRNARIVRGE